MKGIGAYTWQALTHKKTVTQSLFIKTVRNGTFDLDLGSASGSKITITWWDGTKESALAGSDYTGSYYRFTKENDGTEREIAIEYSAGFISATWFSSWDDQLIFDANFLFTNMTNAKVIMIEASRTMTSDLTYVNISPALLQFRIRYSNFVGNLSNKDFSGCQLLFLESTTPDVIVNVATIKIGENLTSGLFDGIQAYGDLNNFRDCNNLSQGRFYYTQITTYTPTGYFGPKNIQWYNCNSLLSNNSSEISEQSLIDLIADKTTYVIENMQLGGSINISGYNPAITDQSTLFKIDLLTTSTDSTVADSNSPYHGYNGYGWTIIHN